MEDHHYGQKENLTGPDIFDKPIDRTKSRQQAEQRFREPETDIREKLEQLPPGSCSAGRLEECLRKSGAAPGKAPSTSTVSRCYP